MSVYPLNFINQTSVDTAFVAVADAIRTQTGSQALIDLTLPTAADFVGAIGDIPVTIQPQLYAPSITKSGSHLDVLGNVNNGAFANGVASIYSGTTKVGEASGMPSGYDLNTLSVGGHSVSATLSGTYCRESEKSTPISVTVYSITKNFTHLTENSVPSYTTKIVNGGTMEIRVTAATNYEFSQSSGYSVTNATVSSWVVTDSMSGGTSNYGILTISNPTGSVVVTITPTLVPQLNTPVISLSGDILTIDDVQDAESYDVYDGDTLVANVPVGGATTAYTVDLTNSSSVCPNLSYNNDAGVEYSTDGGVTWITLGSGINDRSTTVTLTDIVQLSIQGVRDDVVASQIYGFNGTSWESLGEIDQLTPYGQLTPYLSDYTKFGVRLDY